MDESMKKRMTKEILNKSLQANVLMMIFTGGSLLCYAKKNRDTFSAREGPPLTLA